MKIGPKYKIARRLGAAIFEKTQNQKFALREGRKLRTKPIRSKTDFGAQMAEKQKARMFYCVTEKQFAKYVSESIEKKTGSPATNLYSNLESRLDNVVWRLGLRPTHLSARQAVAHGHFTVNGRKTYTPSYKIKKGDVIGIREGSKKSPMFAEIASLSTKIPAWLSFDPVKSEATIVGEPVFEGELALLFDLGQVIEFYQR